MRPAVLPGQHSLYVDLLSEVEVVRILHTGLEGAGAILILYCDRSLRYTSDTSHIIVMLAHTAITLQVLQCYTVISRHLCCPQSLRVLHWIFVRKILIIASIPCVLVTVISEHVVHLRLILAEALQAVVLRQHLVLMAGHWEINWDQLSWSFNVLTMFRCDGDFSQ